MELEKRNRERVHPSPNVGETGNFAKVNDGSECQLCGSAAWVCSVRVALKWVISSKGDTKNAVCQKRAFGIADHLRTTGQTRWDVDFLISMSGLFSRRIPLSVLICSPWDRHPYRPKPSEVFPWHMFLLSCLHWVPGILLSYQHLPLLVNSPTSTSR